jgi:hypothetical protein
MDEGTSDMKPSVLSLPLASCFLQKLQSRKNVIIGSNSKTQTVRRE